MNLELPLEQNELLNSGSIGSNIALMDQNMIDLVDGLIDASPENQISAKSNSRND